ncbi:hypothetical protein EHP00_462 [Ecytonucleospora hepatopenaei]|uniref:Uncharacterized protein n=1 Tax=Ecytonucleospora hepatopenaei TaxID=646526 RepID=A0A1W0E904_9MICR|nr:hypothetical protein EHP00_462 [Ecytonucleospora hepatopenaei]
MDLKIKNNVKNEQITEEIIHFLLGKSSEQLLIIGPDPFVIEKIIKKIVKEFNENLKQNFVDDEKSKKKNKKQIQLTHEVVYINTKKETNLNNKIFIIDISLSTSMQYQSVLYYYLERVLDHNCIVILTSTSIQCLNSFEKRVKSRFKNKIFMLGYSKKIQDASGDKKKESVSPENNKNTDVLNVKNNFTEKLNYKENKVDFLMCKSTVQEQRAFDFMKKYSLQHYSIDFISEMLEPLHFIIMILFFKKNIKIKQNQVYENFKKLQIKELYCSDENDILYAYYDLLEFRWINGNGEVMIDKEEFMESVEKYCPLYIKKLV